MNIFRLHAILALAPFVVALSACSAGSPVETGDEPTSTTEEGLHHGASCPGGATYRVLRLEGPDAPRVCPPIPGASGTWKATPSSTPGVCRFLDEKATGTPLLCEYAWHGTRGASPDVSALAALPETFFASEAPGGGDGACAVSSPLPYIAMQAQAGVSCLLALGHGGPNGPATCDVCGLPVFPGIVGDRLILPSWTPITTFAVTLSSGSTQIVTVPKAKSSSGYVRVPLAAPPAGVSYVTGPALGYAYAPKATP